MRDRGISRNWRERTALPPRVHIDAARTTWEAVVSQGTLHSTRGGDSNTMMDECVRDGIQEINTNCVMVEGEAA